MAAPSKAGLTPGREAPLPDAPVVSVIIPMRNEERYIEGCLRSLAAQEYPRDRLEVLLVDGASTDRSREAAERVAAREGLPLTVIENPDRTTACGLNLGIARARGEVIVRIDAHAEAGSGFLREAVSVLRESGADVVGGPIDSAGRGLVGRAIAAAMSSPFGVGSAVFRYSHREQETDTVAFPAYRRDVFQRAGLFAEDVDGGEDDEFHFRLGELGARILLTPRITTIYHPRESLAGLWRQYFGYGRAKVRVLALHPSKARARHLIPAAFATALAVSATAAAALRGPFLAAPAVAVGAYGVASLAASVAVARRRGWRLLPVLPVAFACLHMGYGLGFLSGLGRGAFLRRRARIPRLEARPERSEGVTA